MKIKYLFLLFVLFLGFSFTNVSASSINYNLQIDKDMFFHENIVYNVDSKDIKRDGTYHFLTYIVDKPVYFDLDESVRYKKSRSTTSTGYKVTLRHDYSYMFLSKTRIINECFTNKTIRTSYNYVSVTLSDFYCAHRADNIKVVINTSLDVLASNATTHNGNSYVWDNISNNFSLRFKVQIPPIEEDPMDHIHDDEDSGESGQSTTTQKKHANKVVILSLIAGFVIFLLCGFVLLKRKKDQLDNF